MPKKIDLPETEVTAVHEAGHVVMAMCFGWPVKSVTNVPTDRDNGLTGLVDDSLNAGRSERREPNSTKDQT